MNILDYEYYFAYGSNMDPRQMKKRCPAAIQVARARLLNWEFFINERGVATLSRRPKHQVMGVVYRITRRCEAALDGYEGVNSGFYGKFWLEVQTLKTDNPRRCLTYIDPSAYEGFPRRGYMEKIMFGAKAAKLPKDYINKLQIWNYDANK